MIVSVGEEGAIFIWDTPAEVQFAEPDNENPTASNEKPKAKPGVKAPTKDTISSSIKKKH